MNINFVTIIKRIIAEQGEGILGDPARLKGFVADYASRESKAERLAFGRCMEHGAYTALKDAPDAQARQSAKAAVARRVHDNEGLDTALCNDVLDALEAAVWGVASEQRSNSEAPSVQRPSYQKDAQALHQSSTAAGSITAGMITRKNPLQYFFAVFKKGLAFNGRASRAEFWWFMLLIYIIFFCIGFILNLEGYWTAIITVIQSNILFLLLLLLLNFGLNILFLPLVLLGGGNMYVILPVWLVILIPFLALLTRRMHDHGQKGYNFLVPVYGFILLIKKGTKGPNKYGPKSR